MKLIFRKKYDRFVQRARELEGVWALVSKDGPLQTKVIDDKWSLAIWNTPAEADAFCGIKKIDGYWPEFIPINDLIAEVLPAVGRQGLGVHPNPQDDPVGLIVPAEGLLRNLRAKP